MSSSALDQPLRLEELLDVAGFRDVCRSISELYGVGIKVFDLDGTKLVDVRTADADLTGYLFNVHATQVLFTNLVTQLRTQPLASRSQATTIQDFCGLTYSVMPIVYEGSPLGRLIFGPYALPTFEGAPASLARYEPELDMKTLAGLLREIPRATESQVRQVLDHVRTVLEVIIHGSYKMLMTNRVHIASITGAFEDLERSNRGLRAANEKLQELDRLKSNFIATVSHELRTPLTSVIGYSEMLLEGMAGALNTEQRDYVRTILEKGESLLGLIGQVLDLSRIESGNVIIAKTATDPRELIRLCVSDVAPQAAKRELKIEVEVADDVTPIVIDADKIRRVITNLLGNAVKFTMPGGRIDVRASITESSTSDGDRFEVAERKRALRLEVSDTGIGIPPETLDRIFDTFFQVDNSSTRQFGGTGLGLSIARNFVAAHGGKIEVSSRPGEGSTFTVTLPYVAEDAEESEPVDGLSAMRL